MALRILIAGGGTSGHINPALAIADHIKGQYPESVIEFCGTSRGIESDIVPRAGYHLHPVRASALPKRPSPKLFRALTDLYKGRKTAIQLIRDFAPDVVVGTGGYVCAPLVSAAHHEKIPVLLHEQNAFPGRSNRYLSKKANVVCTGFPNLEQEFPHAGQVIFSGNPVRDVFFQTNREAARAELGLGEEDFFLLAIGGSLGARTINQAICALDTEKVAQKKSIKIVLASGQKQFDEVNTLLQGEKYTVLRQLLEVKEYIYNPHIYLAAADLVLCRAGAVTCAEVAAVKAASIMVPYPYAAGDHQTYNAKVLALGGATKLVADQEMTGERLTDLLLEFIDNKELRDAMGDAAGAFARQNAVEIICQSIYQLSKGKGV